jgi:hypothetical protein
LIRQLLREARVVVVVGVACSVTSGVDAQWPPIKPGVWELSASRTLTDRKTQSWKRQSRSCDDPTLLFKGYWGLGILEKAGCQYRSVKVSEGQFKITSECMIRGAGRATSEATVVLKEDREFQMTVHVNEGQQVYKITENGVRVADCGCGPTP